MAYKQRNWPAILQEIDESGLSLKEYSLRSNIPYSTICCHCKKAKKRSSVPEVQASAETMSFVRIDAGDVIETQNSSVIRIRIGKAVIEVDGYVSKSMLTRVLEAVHACA